MWESQVITVWSEGASCGGLCAPCVNVETWEEASLAWRENDSHTTGKGAVSGRHRLAFPTALTSWASTSWDPAESDQDTSGLQGPAFQCYPVSGIFWPKDKEATATTRKTRNWTSVLRLEERKKRLWEGQVTKQVPSRDGDSNAGSCPSLASQPLCGQWMSITNKQTSFSSLAKDSQKTLFNQHTMSVVWTLLHNKDREPKSQDRFHPKSRRPVAFLGAKLIPRWPCQSNCSERKTSHQDQGNKSWGQCSHTRVQEMHSCR